MLRNSLVVTQMALALILLVVTANLASMAIVREKELGTLEQINVTPLRRWELIVGKLLPYGVIAMVDVLLVVAVALVVYVRRWIELFAERLQQGASVGPS